MGNRPDGQGTTRLHLDVTDAANIMTWTADPAQTGAIWHIFDRDHTSRIREAVRSLGLCPRDVDPIHSQSVYLGPDALFELARQFNVRPWVISQRVGDIVIVPAGCLHQVALIPDLCDEEALKDRPDVRFGTCKVRSRWPAISSRRPTCPGLHK